MIMNIVLRRGLFCRGYDKSLGGQGRGYNRPFGAARK